MIIRWIVLLIALLAADVISVPIFAVLIALTIARSITNLYQATAEKASKEREMDTTFKCLMDMAVKKDKEEYDNLTSTE